MFPLADPSQVRCLNVGIHGRSGGIRTHDNLRPRQVRYQAALRSVFRKNEIGAAKNFLQRTLGRGTSAPPSCHAGECSAERQKRNGGESRYRAWPARRLKIYSLHRVFSGITRLEPCNHTTSSGHEPDEKADAEHDDGRLGDESPRNHPCTSHVDPSGACSAIQRSPSMAFLTFVGVSTQ